MIVSNFYCLVVFGINTTLVILRTSDFRSTFSPYIPNFAEFPPDLRIQRITPRPRFGIWIPTKVVVSQTQLRIVLRGPNVFMRFLLGPQLACSPGDCDGSKTAIIDPRVACVAFRVICKE